MKPTSHIFYVTAFAALLASCVSNDSTHSPVPSPQSPAFIAGIQYATETGGAGEETAEVFIFNPGKFPVTFTNAVLAGMALPDIGDSARRRASRSFRFDIGGRSVAAPRETAEDERAHWWQFQPSATLPPGGSGVFQINFKNEFGHSRAYPLSLHASDGTELSATIPRYAPPNRRITAIAWSEDGRKMIIQHTLDTPPASVAVNGRAMKFRALPPNMKGKDGAVLINLSEPAKRGQTVMIELDFGEGAKRLGFCRAAPGIMLDGTDSEDTAKLLPKETRRAYGLDDAPFMSLLPFDVVCDDTRAKKHGHSAKNVVAARVTDFQKKPDLLQGVDFCTALYGAVWNIYAPIADVVMVKPYQLHWGANPAMFIEREDEHIARAVRAASPRQTVWVPERFKRDRHMEGRELNTLAWMALMRGVKGIRYHYWKNNAVEPFKDCPDIDTALRALNADIAKLRPILSPLVPLGRREDRANMLTIYESWSGDAGALLLIRNMRYSTDAEANDNGASPRFRVTQSENVPISFTPPPWLKPAAPIDPLTSAAYPCAATATGSLKITLPELDATRLIWIPNAESRE